MSDRKPESSGVCPICGFWTENLQDHLDDAPRFYGTDETDTLDTVAEVAVHPDGTYAVDVVIVEKP